MSYRELIYYKSKLKTLHIDDKFLKEDIKNIDNHSTGKHREYQNTGCCKANIAYKKYLDDIENDELDKNKVEPNKNAAEIIIIESNKIHNV